MKIVVAGANGGPSGETVEVEVDPIGAESNLFISVDGVVAGSLFFGVDAQGIKYITFGAIDEDEAWWMAATPKHTQGYSEPASLSIPTS